jgi:hypothetical protein
MQLEQKPRIRWLGYLWQCEQPNTDGISVNVGIGYTPKQAYDYCLQAKDEFRPFNKARRMTNGR